MRDYRQQKLEWGMVGLFALVCALLFTLGWLSFRDHQAYLRSEIRINRVNEQLRALNVTLITLQDAETGQRGYLLTGDTTYLAPYTAALGQVDGSLARLVETMREEDAYAEDLLAIGQLKAEKLEELATTVRLRQQNDVAGALAVVNSDRGKQLMDELRQRMGAIMTAKRAELRQINQTSHQRASRARISTLLFGAAILGSMLFAFAVLFHDLRERRRLKQTAEFAQHHDELTGLHNRRFFRTLLDNRLKHAYRDGGRSAIMFINVNNFQSVNQEFGYAAGSRLLIEIGNRLAQTARKGDVAARLRDDEFGIVVPEVHSTDEIARFAGRLIDALTPALIPDMPDRYVGVSIGIAFYPDDARDSAALLTRANEAVTKAKRDGRNRYRFYRDTLHAARNRTELLTSGLHRAVERGELSLRFQPQVDAQSGRIVGVESLIRWEHPELGAVSPEEFIPLAEKSGLIVPIGAWVLRETCLHVARWNRQGNAWRAAVNVSPMELVGENFSRVIAEALEQAGLPASQLELEITERALMTPGAVSELEQLRAGGVRVSIDDFGTGYSSLSYLARFSFDVLKIDKSFLSDVPASDKDCGLVKTIISMGRELGIKVVAEGVETAEQARFLRNSGCHLGQGYLFCRPVTAREMNRMSLSGMPLASSAGGLLA